MVINKSKCDKFKDINYKRRVLQVRKCEHCGHSVDFRSGLLYYICNYCGKRIYRNNKIKFKIELQERLKKNNDTNIQRILGVTETTIYNIRRKYRKEKQNEKHYDVELYQKKKKKND